MTAIRNQISSLNIQRELKEKLIELVTDENEWIYFIFYAKANLLTLPTITIVGEGKIIYDLITQIWVVESIEKYKIFINIIEIDQLYVNRTISHKIYYHLNCQNDQLIYKVDEDYNEYLEYFKKTDKEKYLKKTKKWFKAKQENYCDILDNYIVNINEFDQSYNFVLKGLQQLLIELITEFEVVFNPMVYLNKNSPKETLVFILTYCKSINVNVPFENKVTLLPLRESEDPIELFLYILDFESSTLVKTHKTTFFVDIVYSFINSLFTDLRKTYVLQYEKRLKELEIYIIREEAKASVKTWEDILSSQVKQLLNNEFRPQSVFLISKKYFNIPESDLKYERGIHYFLIALTHKITDQSIKQFSNTIEKKTNGKAKVTLLLQRKSNWTRHIPVFLDFYKNYFKTINLFQGANFYFDYNKVECNTMNSQRQYIHECLNLIENAFTSINQSNEKQFSETHTMLYHFALQQSFILLIYSKLNFIPHIIELRYLWDLIQWCFPSIYRELDELPTVKRILFNNQYFVKAYPQKNEDISNITAVGVKEVDDFCNAIYIFTKEHLINAPSIILDITEDE